MNSFRKITGLIAAAALLTGLAACGKKDGGTIDGAGATFPYPLYSAWAAGYNKDTGVKLNYQSIGSGGGVRQIVSRTVAFGASDDALKAEEINKQNLLQWPQAIGGIVVIFNTQGLEAGKLTLDAETACKIFLGEIKTFNDPALKTLNPDVKLPEAPITVVHRSDGSGTTAVFTHYLSEVCPAWKRVGEGKSVNWPVGLGGKGNEGVANYVKSQANSVGYVEFAYAMQNKIAYALMKNAAGAVVKPTLETFADAAASVEYDPSKHFYTWATNGKGKDAWPIVAATNILVDKDKKDVGMKVVKFFEYGFSQDGDETAKRLMYAPLPGPLKEKVRKYWKDNGLM